MKQHDYVLKQTANCEYQYLLLATSLSRLEDYIHDVELELLSRKVTKGVVIFDLLLNNNIQDRFYQCYFNGELFEISKFKKIDSRIIDKKIMQISADFYIKNMQIFDSLFFSNDFKKELKNKLLNSL